MRLTFFHRRPPRDPWAPGPNASQLNAKVIRRLKRGSFEVYQLDGTAYPGNSGGPLFELEKGEVIGIINMVFVKGTKESVLTQPSGISFAIPIDVAMKVEQQIVAHGKVTRGRLGVAIQDVSAKVLPRRRLSTFL